MTISNMNKILDEHKDEMTDLSIQVGEPITSCSPNPIAVSLVMKADRYWARS